MTSIALSLVAGFGTAGSEREFLNAISAVSPEAKHLTTLYSPADDTRVDARHLLKEAVAHSDGWAAKVLSPAALLGQEKVEWAGENSKSKPSKVFAKSWTNALGSFVWKDDGTLTALMFVPSKPQKVKTPQEAANFAEAQLKLISNLPSGQPIENFLKGKGPFAGSVLRGKLIDAGTHGGLKMRKFEGELAWHNSYFVSTDGERLLFRFNFYGEPHDKMQVVANSNTRW